MAAALAEEFAYDSLVDRLPSYDELEPLLVQHGQGKWTSQYSKQCEFRRTLPNEDAAKTDRTSERVKLRFGHH